MVVGSTLPVPTSSLLAKLCPLVLDGSGLVRAQLPRLFGSLPSSDIQDHASVILPYIRAGMTHLSADIRASAMNLLSWLLSVAGEEIVGCAGGWQKTLECFFTTLGWQVRNHEKWSANKTSVSKFASDSKVLARNLQVLAEFIRAGIGNDGVPSVMDDVDDALANARLYPLWHTRQHMISKKSNAFGYLNLFGIIRDHDNRMLDDRDDRRRMFNELFRPAVMAGLENAKKEGGEPGRAAGLVNKAMKEAALDE
jgi:pre-rRNA-processing protein IPI1